MLGLLVRPLPPPLWLPSASTIEDAICSHADALVTGSVVPHLQLTSASPSTSGREASGLGGGGDGDAKSVEGVAIGRVAVGDADLDVDVDVDALFSALSGEVLVRT